MATTLRKTSHTQVITSTKICGLQSNSNLNINKGKCLQSEKKSVNLKIFIVKVIKSFVSSTVSVITLTRVRFLKSKSNLNTDKEKWIQSEKKSVNLKIVIVKVSKSFVSSTILDNYFNKSLLL